VFESTLTEAPDSLSDDGSPREESPRPRGRLLFKQAIKANMFLNRLSHGERLEAQAPLPDVNVDIGSLAHFIDSRKLPKEFATSLSTASTAPSPPVSPKGGGPRQSQPTQAPASPVPVAPPLPGGGPRRHVLRRGDRVSELRVACPRNKQLSELSRQLPSLAGASPRRPLSAAPSEHADGMAPAEAASAGAKATPRRGERPQAPGAVAAAGTSMVSGGSSSSSSQPPATAAAAAAPPPKSARRRRGDSAFTADFVKGGSAKPRIDQHPLLVAIEEGDSDLQQRAPDLDSDQAVLASRFAELRWNEPRRGPWVAAPDARRPEADDGTLLKASVRKALEGKPQSKRPGGGGGSGALGSAGGSRGSERGVKGQMPGVTEDWAALVREMDPEGSGWVSPDVVVPLMFWLGLTRKRGAALATLELAFGPGDIATSSLQELCPYVDVQARLVEGLKKQARRESLEPLCEFMTDSNLMRLRAWFYSMKRSPSGHVDLMEVQNLFAREGVTTDRQAFFRYLSYISQTSSLPSAREGEGGKKNALLSKIGIEEFTSIIGRCTVAWCLHRTVSLVTDPEFATAASAMAAGQPSGATSAAAKVVPAPAPAPGGGGTDNGGEAPFAQALESHNMSLSWTQLQRKIMVSLLVNHRFWGRESRHVLNSLKPPHANSIGEELTPEQWRCLFERVKAQGLAAILPLGNEADNPGFLEGKTRHDDAPGLPVAAQPASAR